MQQLDREDLKDWMGETRMLYASLPASSDKYRKKRFWVCLSGTFDVELITQDDTLHVCGTEDIEAAIAAFNEENLEIFDPRPQDPVRWEEGKWWYYDETWSDRNGPFSSQDEARKACIEYAKSL